MTKNKDSVSLRPIPNKSPWYVRQKSAYQSKREGKKTLKGFLILITFIVLIILLVLLIGGAL